jgi:transposase
MDTPPPALPLRRSRPAAWRPMTDAEWDALRPVVASRLGRPPRDLRQVWDGIFWIACSRLPWTALPARFGRADTAHRTLRRAAEGRRLHVLLLMVSDHPEARRSGLHGLEWPIVRAFRRAFRVAFGAIAYSTRLGLLSALPADPWWLPKPHLSERLDTYIELVRQTLPNPPPGFLGWLLRYARIVGGEPRMWRTTG